MSTCRNCGQDITFRYIDGVCTPIHLDGGRCGGWSADDDAVKGARRMGCKHCGKMVWFVQNNGGFWWFDHLGVPWPKHACYQSHSSSSKLPDYLQESIAPQVTEAYDRTARAFRRCEVCNASVKLTRYVNHLSTAHKKTKPPTSSLIVFRQKERERREVSAPISPTVAVAVESSDRRQCQICKVMVRSARYERHLRKAHGKGEAVDVRRQSRVLLTVHGIGGTSAVLLNDDLSLLPQHTIKSRDQGTPVSFNCVLLSDVLAKVTVPAGDAFLNTASSYYMLAEALDGNRAVFAWAELDPTFMDKSIYVVTRRDGKPLSEKDGPIQLLVPSDKRNARQIRQVTALKIRQAN
jgi:hypothetical protein